MTVQHEELDMPQAGPRAARGPSWRELSPGREPSGTRDRAGREEGGLRRLLIIAGGIGAALVLVLAVLSLGGRQDAPIPVVQADPRPVRVKPADPGGMRVANDDIFSAGDGQDQNLAAPAETPNPAALKAEAPGHPATQATQPPQPPSPTVAPTAGAAPARVAVPGSAQQSQGMAPAGPPAISTPSAAPGRASAPPALEASRAARQVVPGRPEVQLAALGSEEAAHAEWKRLAGRFPDLLARHQPLFVKTEREGREIWRLRLGGFEDVAEATRFCEALRARKAGCAIASF